MSKGRVLNGEEKIQIAIRIAHYWRDKDIVDFVKSEFGKTISQPMISAYRRIEKWQPIIKHHREEYNKSVLEVPLANKRKRLDELQHLYELSMENKKYERAQSVLRDFREEMEGKTASNNFYLTQINQQNEFNVLSDDQLSEMKIKELENLKRLRSITKNRLPQITQESLGEFNDE